MAGRVGGRLDAHRAAHAGVAACRPGGLALEIQGATLLMHLAPALHALHALVEKLRQRRPGRSLDEAPHHLGGVVERGKKSPVLWQQVRAAPEDELPGMRAVLQPENRVDRLPGWGLGSACAVEDARASRLT